MFGAISRRNKDASRTVSYPARCGDILIAVFRVRGRVSDSRIGLQ